MDPRLEEACHTGNLGMLRILLIEDKLLLHRFSSSSGSSTSIDNPLHIAASLGHTDVADEIMVKNPGLATDLNPRGLSALHLASAHGHLEIVKLLISKVGLHLCSLKDKDGSLAVHIAAMKGRIDILEEHMKVWPESARALTCRNESILHLAVQSNSFETVEFLLKNLSTATDDDNNELLNLRDDKGNTILHHAVARRQLPSVKLLLSKGESVEVNARNHNGLTALDVLLEAPRETGDLALAEMIRAAGGKMGSEMGPHQPSLQTNTSTNEPSSSPPTPPPSRSWVCSLFRFRRRTGLQKKTKKQGKVEDNYTPGQLMVVATLIATITFTAGLNPPGGVNQAGNGNSSNSTPPAGVAVLDSKLGTFLLLDMVGLFASLSIILILICAAPRKKKIMMKILVVIMWIAVFSTALAFSAAIKLIFPSSNWMKSAMVEGWFLILEIFMWWVFMRCVVYLLRKVGWWRMKEGNRASDIVRKGGCLLWLMRIGAVMLILFLPFLLILSLRFCFSLSRVFKPELMYPKGVIF